MKKYAIQKIITSILAIGFILIGLIDGLLYGKSSYSAIMGADINRVFFYNFFLIIIGSWLLYHRWFVGIGFTALAAFNAYFIELLNVHNYFASISVYIGIIVDVLIRRKFKWMIPLGIVGIIQGIVFQTRLLTHYVVGSMEFLALCVGAIFVVRNIGNEDKKLKK